MKFRYYLPQKASGLTLEFIKEQRLFNVIKI